MIRVVLIWLMLVSTAFAQDLAGIARVDVENSRVVDRADGVDIELVLSQIVPYRVFTLAEPKRLVLDFREVDWTGLSSEAFDQAARIESVNFGALRPGWSRMVLQLSGPFAVRQVAANIDTDTGIAKLNLNLEPVDPEEFFDLAGQPDNLGWKNALPDPVEIAPAIENDDLIVVIDPGHGGIDPGAQHGGQTEANVVLALGIEVAEALSRVEGVTAILTRDRDQFVPLTQRITIARQNNADLMISLHADALAEGQARGGSVYTLSQEAASGAAQRLAERHERGDLIAGLDLANQDDRVAGVLMDLARAETGPKGMRFAAALVAELRVQDIRMHRNALRNGPFAVLNAADFASVLFEVGYLSNPSDREILQDAAKRAVIVEAIVSAVTFWALQEEARN